MSQRIYLQPSFILHRRAFRETSMLLEVLSQEYGRISLLAKGVKRKQKNGQGGMLEPFNLLALSWVPKTNLSILTDVELLSAPHQLQQKVLYSAFYLNELMLKLVPNEEHDPNIFKLYSDAMCAFYKCSSKKNNSVEQILRRFEKSLISQLGYALELEKTSDPNLTIYSGAYYKYLPHSGFVFLHEHDNLLNQIDVFAGSDIIAISNDDYSEASYLSAAKKLFKMVLSQHLEGQRIKTRSLFT